MHDRQPPPSADRAKSAEAEVVVATPNRVWLADITYIATDEGWLYLAAVLDLATHKIVVWSMGDHMRTELPLVALMMAAQQQRPAESLVCHSDRGSQYASEGYAKQLIAMKASPSMNRTVCYHNNAPMVSFHILNAKIAHYRRWVPREEARRDLFPYIEFYYNRRRIHSAPGYKPRNNPNGKWPKPEYTKTGDH